MMTLLRTQVETALEKHRFPLHLHPQYPISLRWVITTVRAGDRFCLRLDDPAPCPRQARGGFHLAPRALLLVLTLFTYSCLCASPEPGDSLLRPQGTAPRRDRKRGPMERTQRLTNLSAREDERGHSSTGSTQPTLAEPGECGTRYGLIFCQRAPPF